MNTLSHADIDIGGISDGSLGGFSVSSPPLPLCSHLSLSLSLVLKPKSLGMKGRGLKPDALPTMVQSHSHLFLAQRGHKERAWRAALGEPRRGGGAGGEGSGQRRGGGARGEPLV